MCVYVCVYYIYITVSDIQEQNFKIFLQDDNTHSHAHTYIHTRHKYTYSYSYMHTYTAHTDTQACIHTFTNMYICISQIHTQCTYLPLNFKSRPVKTYVHTSRESGCSVTPSLIWRSSWANVKPKCKRRHTTGDGSYCMTWWMLASKHWQKTKTRRNIKLYIPPCTLNIK